ncbi:lactonase family protein [Zhouia sp. PK063]|uniref:lactonase family protein n=1 Tax=Zhouia sp. PK063 TaxID=3373602 RepID=UPI0037B1004C
MKKTSIVLFASFILSIVACKQQKKEVTTNNESVTEQMNVDNINPVYIGTYTKKEGHVDGKADGIYLMNKKEDGSLEMVKTVAKITNPSYVKISADKKNLYAVSELTDSEAASGFIYSFKINDDFSLTQIGKLSTNGFAPCHIGIDHTDTYVFAANYADGVVTEYQRDSTGILSAIATLELNKIHPKENTGKAHAHEVTLSANNKFAYINDLGNDKVWIYDFDEKTGKLTANKQPYIAVAKGAGPRHFAFTPNQKYAYVINELNSTINVFSYHQETGELTNIQTISTLPSDYDGKSYCAEIEVHPNGHYLYASNRGHNSITAFKIDEETGQLSVINFQSTEGDYPRHFIINKQGDKIYAANQNTSNITVLDINTENGSLSSAHQNVAVNTPVCIALYN